LSPEIAAYFAMWICQLRQTDKFRVLKWNNCRVGRGFNREGVA
jgi:hypothetical protein